jgi:uncharacterized protein (UPF0335 family)
MRILVHDVHAHVVVLRNEAESCVQEYTERIGRLESECASLREQVHGKTEPSNDAGADNGKMMKMTNKLKRVVQIFKEKIQRVASERPDLFVGVGEETNERLDHLISIVQQQADHIAELDMTHDQMEKRFQNEMEEWKRLESVLADDSSLSSTISFCFSSLESCQEQLSECKRTRVDDVASPSTMVAIKGELEMDDTIREDAHVRANMSNDNQWNDWYTQSPLIGNRQLDCCDSEIQCELLNDNDDVKETMPMVKLSVQLTGVNRLDDELKNVASPWSEQETSANDWDDQRSPLELPSDDSFVNQLSRSSFPMEHDLQHMQIKIQQIVSQYSEHFPHSTGNLIEDFDRLISMIDAFGEEIGALKR